MPKKKEHKNLGSKFTTNRLLSTDIKKMKLLKTGKKNLLV